MFSKGVCFKKLFLFPIKMIAQKEGGTQLKLVIEYAPGGLAMLKPMRYVELTLN